MSDSHNVYVITRGDRFQAAHAASEHHVLLAHVREIIHKDRTRRSVGLTHPRFLPFVAKWQDEGGDGPGSVFSIACDAMHALLALKEKLGRPIGARSTPDRCPICGQNRRTPDGRPNPYPRAAHSCAGCSR